MKSSIIQSDPDILGGVPVFRGTRVPIEVLFDYLQEDTVADFLRGYPHITREMVNEVFALVAHQFTLKIPRKKHYEIAA
jgi:uncharacterized protein (DUF433 family)